jgi:hypothetical protein
MWEVMTTHIPGARGLRRAWHEVSYWVQLALLSVLGPAQLDDEHDPIEQLKRAHHRPPSR